MGPRPPRSAILLAGISRLVGGRMRGKFSEIGLRHAQAMVLFHLWHDDGMAQNTLARRLHVTPPTATNTLQRMERDGWIERTRDPLDQRIVRVSLTTKAKALRAETGAAFHALDHELADILTDSEREVFLRVVEKGSPRALPEAKTGLALAQMRSRMKNRTTKPTG